MLLNALAGAKIKDPLVTNLQCSRRYTIYLNVSVVIEFSQLRKFQGLECIKCF